MSISLATMGRLCPISIIIREIASDLTVTVENPVVIESDISEVSEIESVEIEACSQITATVYLVDTD